MLQVSVLQAHCHPRLERPKWRDWGTACLFLLANRGAGGSQCRSDKSPEHRCVNACDPIPKTRTRSVLQPMLYLARAHCHPRLERPKWRDWGTACLFLLANRGAGGSQCRSDKSPEHRCVNACDPIPKTRTRSVLQPMLYLARAHCHPRLERPKWRDGGTACLFLLANIGALGLQCRSDKSSEHRCVNACDPIPKKTERAE